MKKIYTYNESCFKGGAVQHDPFRVTISLPPCAVRIGFNLDRDTMILTCPQCQTGYALDDRLLGERGRTVSCKSCAHKWFQAPPTPRTAPEEETPASFGEMMQETAREEPPAPAPEIIQAPAQVPAAPAIPEAIRPRATEMKSPPGKVYKPMGVGPGQFGFLTFLACVFACAIPLLLMRGPLVRMFPPLSLLYETLGIKTLAPGEGLRLSELTVENRVDKAQRVLRVSARLSNLMPRPTPTPLMKIRLSSAYGVTLKEWTLRADAAGRAMAAGESLPLKFEFPDAPEGGATVDIKVVPE